jgi:hypothetical protein
MLYISSASTQKTSPLIFMHLPDETQLDLLTGKLAGSQTSKYLPARASCENQLILQKYHGAIQ